MTSARGKSASDRHGHSFSLILNACIFASSVEAIVAMERADTVTTQSGSLFRALRGQM